MSTRTYIEERLKDSSLSDEAREALKKALESQGEFIHGFKVGEEVKWNYKGQLGQGVVTSWKPFRERWPTGYDDHVPVKQGETHFGFPKQYVSRLAE